VSAVYLLSYGTAKSYKRAHPRGVGLWYSHGPHNDVTVDDPHIRPWYHKIVILSIVLQLPTVLRTGPG